MLTDFVSLQTVSHTSTEAVQHIQAEQIFAEDTITMVAQHLVLHHMHGLVGLIGMGYYGAMGGSGDVTYKIGGVKPLPDTFAPVVTHSGLADSHSTSRNIAAIISDAGDPASGLNVSTTAGVGPTMVYRVTPDGGTAGSWTSEVMSPGTGTTRTQCVLAACTWSADIEDLDRGDSVEYYLTAQDVSPVAAGANSVTTATESFMVGDPNKMFIVEWRDMQYTSSNRPMYVPSCLL